MLWKWFFRLLIIFLGIWLFLDLVSRLGAEIFWFQNVGYLQVFLLRIITKGGLWILVAGVTTTFLIGNLRLAQQLKYPDSLKIKEVRREEAAIDSDLQNFLSPRYLRTDETQTPKSRTKPLRLVWLLPIALGLSLLVGLMLAHYGEIAVSYWHSPMIRTIPPVPPLFRAERIWQLMSVQIVSQGWYIALVAGIAIAIITYPGFFLNAIALAFSVLFAWVLSHNWARVLQYFSPTSFNASEPLFGLDISFYIFSLPFWELFELWLMGLFLYAFVAVSLTYLLCADSLSQGIFPGLSSQQQRHLYGLGGLFMLVVALSYWLSRYELVYSQRGVTYGASYTDVSAVLPAYTILCFFALVVAFYLLWRTFSWKPQSRYRQFIFYGLGLYLVLVVAADFVVPNVVQYLIVQPNELQREQPYIERTIALTRQAFDLDVIDAQTFNPTGDLTETDIQNNDLTIRNIRLWDQQPLLETNRQLQQIRLYYRFPDADIDRYRLFKEVPAKKPTATEAVTEANQEQNEVTERRQVLIAARELDYTAVPQQAQTWVNRHLIYTHGFGFTMSPVNTVGPGGLPEYFVKDIAGNDESPLTTSSEAIRDSVPIGEPRIYFGEITNTHVMTGTRVRELDFPSGSDNVYNIYDGVGGIGIGTGWRRLLFAMYLKDWQMLFTRDFLPDTKVLFRRNIKERIQAIAPFLQFDSDPYLVAADGSPDNGDGDFPSNGNYLYWIVDAYTTSDRYPYSDTTSAEINYIRNSVKIVIDAYHGTVNFYIADTRDPIINTWSKIFPHTFKPLSDLPATLLSHIRYPVDYFKIQSERLMTYHMTDPQVFYNREDQWQIPNEIYGSEARPVDPYYLITSLPTVPFVDAASAREEFILLLPYTPRQRSNLIAWLAARSDGENYGKLLLYVFPKERLVFGPEQIEARINQDPVISQQISLWNRQGSRAVQGNLLIIPIEQSLLYVEPIYLEATQNRLPTLVRVIVAFENRIVMAPTLEQALQGIFQPEVTPAPAIIRPVEEPAPSE
ncbi:UPF0182 family protein [Nodularia sp. NIES-3585]|uniref:UPF0182 family protein n=1 Tax=Nodularia sp. NIES-3585 TaxID=1973477 RepID=UPI000B5CF141|nr:UPF0182 family protein [Nodularia sp. NIES-3585]GAX37031.1 hypothetical protein NIES3585_30700 [Nodularia sp. NIES-3585]